MPRGGGGAPPGTMHVMEHESHAPVPGQEPGTVSPPEVALMNHVEDNEGNTLANWTMCGGIILATLVGGIGVVIAQLWVVILGAALVVVSLVAGFVIKRFEDREDSTATAAERAPAGDDGDVATVRADSGH